MNAPDKAYDYYKKAAEISPDVPLYHTGAGVSLLGVYMEKAKASIDAFQKALQLDPNNVAALEGLGTVYVSIDRKNLARELHGRLKELDAGAAQRLNEMILYGVDWGQ
jgi:tetratricopeptide (TPR) repeat protein